MQEIQLHRLDLNLLVVFEALMLEGSVAGAADKLGKTPSAVSHALARLRDQVGDPLIVKVGGRMQASPFALILIDEVRPILRSIKRVMAQAAPFDPATSDRVFRIAMPTIPQVIHRVMNEVYAGAPGVRLDWLRPDNAAYPAVAEGLYDLAHLSGEARLPEGLDEAEMPAASRTSFVRKDHPALNNWGAQAWSKWPHIVVSSANSTHSQVETVQAKAGLVRHIGTQISDFWGLGSLVAHTDSIATFPPLFMTEHMQVWGLRALPPPMDFAPFRVRFFWSSRLARDPGCSWLRKIVLRIYHEEHDTAEALVARAIQVASDA